jgi:hypothetical protein
VSIIYSIEPAFLADFLSSTASSFTMLEEGVNAHLRRRRIDIGVQFLMGSGCFSSTKMIHFVPRFILVNNTNAELLLRQPNDGDEVLQLSPLSRAPLHWSIRNKQRWLQMSLKRDVWSGLFNVHEVSQFTVKLESSVPLSSSSSPTLVPVVHAVFSCHVQASASSIFAVFSAKSLDSLPYRIVNSTAADLRYRQHLGSTSRGCSLPLHTLQAGQSVPYAWDMPGASRPHLLELRTDGWYGTAELDKLGLDVIVGPPLAPLRLSVRRACGVKVLTVGTISERRRRRQQRVQENQLSTPADTEVAKMRFRFCLKRAHISIIDERPSEIAVVSFDDIQILGCSNDFEHKVGALRAYLYCLLTRIGS